ncbi:MAG: methyltransferase domain-containing protein [Candidatus Cybelea sp.]
MSEDAEARSEVIGEIRIERGGRRRAGNANVDFGKTATDYGRYRAGFPNALFDRLLALGVGRAGSAALDMGTGTGTLGRGFALRGCKVVGLDPSSALLDEARRLDAEFGITTTGYLEGRAENLPFDGAAFDLVAAGQCWHWFDRSRAAAEAHRVLKPGGRIVIAHFDWIPLPGNVVDATEQLITQHNPQWKMAGGTGLHARFLTDIAIAGFTGIETFSFDVGAPYTHEAWRGRIRASAGVAASLSPKNVSEFDADLARLLEREYPEDPLLVPHRVWAVTATR